LPEPEEVFSYYRKNVQLPFEKDTIGLIICAEKGKEEVHYALDTAWMIGFLLQSIRQSYPVRRRLRESLGKRWYKVKKELI